MVRLKKSKLFSKLTKSPNSLDSISRNDIKVLHPPSSELLTPSIPYVSSLNSSPLSSKSPKRKSNKCKLCELVLTSDSIFLNCGDSYHETCFASLHQIDNPLCACGEPLILKEDSDSNSNSNPNCTDSGSNLSLPMKLLPNAHKSSPRSFMIETTTPTSTPVIPSSPFINNHSTINQLYFPQVKFNLKQDKLVKFTISNPIIFNEAELDSSESNNIDSNLLQGLKIDLSEDGNLEFPAKLSDFTNSFESINEQGNGISSLNINGKLLPPYKIDEKLRDQDICNGQNETHEPNTSKPLSTPKNEVISHFITPTKSSSIPESNTKDKVVKEFTRKLTEIENWFDYIDDNALGDLVLFDFLNITTNGLDWDLVLCVLFERTLLMINDKKLIGIVSVDDIVKINRQDNMLTLLMINELLPELQMNEQDLVILKWEHYLNQLVTKNSISVNLMQLTTNGWDEIPSNLVSDDIQHFNNIYKGSCQIPVKYLIQMLPKPDILPLNLILSVCVINNNSGLTNDQYRTQLIKMINIIRTNLRSIDQLGLIFIGTDGSKYCFNKGSFIGCVSSSWDGWDRILEDLQIYNNDQSITTNLQELQIVFEKLFDIYPFIPNKNHINKVIILNLNNFEDEIVKNDLLIRRISTMEKLSITLIRIGKENETIQYINRLISRPTKDLKIIYGENILRFQSLDNFLSTLPELIENYKHIIIPTLSISLQGSIEKIEINGKLVDIQTSISSPPMSPLLSLLQNNITLLVKDIIPHQLRNIDIVASSGTIHYTTRWLNSKIQNTIQI